MTQLWMTLSGRVQQVRRRVGRQRHRLKALVRDLGPGGLLVCSEHILMSGNVLELAFTEPQAGLDLRVRAQLLAFVQAQQPRTTTSAGVAVNEPTPLKRAA
ncbi:MAG: hypothetical protein NVSMB2_00460 [Chloroflexota bacterium]